MRVISGSARGTKLIFLENDSIRPTTDKVKEAIFDVIQFKLKGSLFLDLFAGSGQMGIEALSRGAKSVYFVDFNRDTVNVINRNLCRLKGICDKDFFVVRNDAFNFLKFNKVKFNIIFMDPPFGKENMENLLNDTKNNITPDGIVICEHSKKDPLPEKVGNLSAFKRKEYGSIAVTFYRLIEY